MCLLPCFPYLSISLACVNFFKLYFFLPLLSSLCLVSDEFPQAIFSLVLLNSMCPVSDNFPRTFSSSLDFDISCEVQCLALLLYLLMCLVIHSQSLLFSCFRCILWAIIFSSFLFYASLSFDDIVDNNISKPYFLDFFCLRCPLGMIISPSCLSFFVVSCSFLNFNNRSLLWECNDFITWPAFVSVNICYWKSILHESNIFCLNFWNNYLNYLQSGWCTQIISERFIYCISRLSSGVYRPG